jgi:DNA replicative helicase MCM subunit Mcm2 (Cdc46/Mcm family)
MNLLCIYHSHPLPMQVIGSLGIALSLLVYVRTRVPYDNDISLKRVQARIVDLSSNYCYSFADLKANAVGRLVSIRGHVIKVSATRPLICRAKFSCTKCGNENLWFPFEDGIYQPPQKCTGSSQNTETGHVTKCNNTFIQDMDRSSVETTGKY